MQFSVSANELKVRDYPTANRTLTLTRATNKGTTFHNDCDNEMTSHVLNQNSLFNCQHMTAFTNIYILPYKNIILHFVQSLLQISTEQIFDH